MSAINAFNFCNSTNQEFATKPITPIQVTKPIVLRCAYCSCPAGKFTYYPYDKDIDLRVCANICYPLINDIHAGDFIISKSNRIELVAAVKMLKYIIKLLKQYPAQVAMELDMVCQIQDTLKTSIPNKRKASQPNVLSLKKEKKEPKKDEQKLFDKAIIANNKL